MSGQTISTSETRIEAIKLQSSAYGVTIPLVFGVTKISGNLVWYGGFKAIPHTTEQGGKGGGVKVQNTSYSYLASVVMGLCHGRITAIPRIWRGKKLYSGGVTGSQLLTASESYTPPSSGAMSYTVAQAASYTAMVSITWTDSESWAHTLAQGYDYTVAAGVVTVLSEFWRSKLLTIKYQYTTGSVSYAALDELGLSFLRGEIAQTMWSGFSSFPSSSDQHLGYSGLALVAGLDYELGTGAQVENHQFEVVGPMAYHLGAAVPDVDPAPMLHEVLTNTRGGASFNPDALDDWSDWSDFCVASGLLVSPGITEQQPAADVLRMAAQLTATGPVWSGGRLKMVPYADTAVTGNGRTFTPNTTPVYDLDDDCFLVSSPGEAPLRARLKSPADRYNHVRVEYLNRLNQYNHDIAEATDLADIEERKRRTMPTVRAHWICEQATARQVAQLLMQRSLYVCNEYEATLPWHYALLEPMDLVTLTDARLELDDTPARITLIEEDEAGELRCEFEDYPAGQASAALYPSDGGSGFAHDYNVAPGDADAPVIFEAPVDRTLTGLALYVAVKGSGANWGGAQVWVSQDGTNYKQMGVVYGSARAGTLSANASAGAASIAVQGLGSEQLLSGSAADATALNTLCYVGGANPEYLAYQTATLTGAGAYTLGGLVHGAYGTGALAHDVDDVFVRVDERVAKSDDLDLSMISKTIFVKLCSFNIYGGAQQGLADVSPTSYTITGVMVAIPPADVAGLSAVAIPGAGRIKWTQNTEPDVPGGAIELRRGDVVDWEAGVKLEDGSAGSTHATGNFYDWAWPPSGTYVIMARHRDALGNLSTNVASTTLVAEPESINTTSGVVMYRTEGATIVASSAFKSAVGDAWDESVWTRSGHRGGAFISARPAQADAYLMIALDRTPSLSEGYADLDYALFAQDAGGLRVYESGVDVGSFGTYAAGDNLSVHYDGANVFYMKNGALLRVVPAPLNSTFFGDIAFYTSGGRVDDIQFGPQSSVTSVGTAQIDENAATLPLLAHGTGVYARAGDAVDGNRIFTFAVLNFPNTSGSTVEVQVEFSVFSVYHYSWNTMTARRLWIQTEGSTLGLDEKDIAQFSEAATFGELPDGVAKAFSFTVPNGNTLIVAVKLRCQSATEAAQINLSPYILRVTPILR